VFLIFGEFSATNNNNNNKLFSVKCTKGFFFFLKKNSKVRKLWGKNQNSPYLDNEYIKRLREQSRIFKSFYFAGWTLPKFGSFLLWTIPSPLTWQNWKEKKKEKNPNGCRLNASISFHFFAILDWLHILILC
jgi:hypothetical protein